MSIHDRTVARSKGCFNCAHFDCATAAVARIKQRIQIDAKYFTEHGVKPEKMPEALAGLEQTLEAIGHGEAGICTSLIAQQELDKLAGRPVHFLTSTYLCHCWDGIAGAQSVQKERATDDALPDELLDRAGMPQPDNSGEGSSGANS